MEIEKIESVALDDVVRLNAVITDTNVANEFGSTYALYQLGFKFDSK